MTYPTGETPKLDLLSIAIGTEFNECSIAAAELNQQVHVELDKIGTNEQTTLYSIGDDPTLGQPFIGRKLLCSVESGDSSYRLALIKPATRRRGRSAVLRRAIENSIDIDGSEPRLVALLYGEDAYVTLATFARREGGTCSYVQLGSEINDDNLFVTAGDEDTSRQNFIEEIRSLVGQTAPDKKNRKPQFMTRLLDIELADKEKQLANAEEAMTVRRAYEAVQVKRHDKLKVVDTKTGEFSSQDLDTHILFSGLQMKDGRSLSIIIGYQGNSLQLFATTRSDIALPIANFDRSTGKIDLYDLEGKLQPEERRSAIDSLHSMVFHRFSPDRYSYQHNYQNQNEAGKREITIARHLDKRGYINLTETHVDRVFTTKIAQHVDKSQIRREIDDFLANPLLTTRYDSAVLKHVQKTIGAHNSTAIHACDRLRVVERLDAAIGASSLSEEQLLAKVRSMADKDETFSAVAHNVQLGKTRGDARVKAQVQRDGTTYSVVISGSPFAMPDEAPRPILRLDVDSTQSLFSRQQYTDEQAAQKAQDILAILNLF